MISLRSMSRPCATRSGAKPANDGARTLSTASAGEPSIAAARDGASTVFVASAEQRSTASPSTAEWVEAHEALSRLAGQRAALDAEEGSLLLRALRSEAHRHLGYGNFFEYIERWFGYGPRTTNDKLRTAEALETLPELSRSFREGRVHGSAVRELARVATAETEREWLEAARGCTVRQIEQLVQGHVRGDRPSDSPRPEARRHILRFDVAAETLATFREAMKRLRQDSGERLDNDSALLLMARHVLEGPEAANPGRASYQIAVVTCDHCSRGFQEAAGERVEVHPEIVEMAACDAQCIGHVEVTPLSLVGQPPSATGRRTASTHMGQSPPVTAPSTQTLDHVDQPLSELEEQPTHVGQPTAERESELSPRGAGRDRSRDSTPRATQTIPPAIRRKVLRRDGHCRVPGCKHATFVDLHHVQPRSEGGQHNADELIVLCSAHHRSVHRGQLFISGSVVTGLNFRHADGSPYGSVGSPRLAAACELVFRGLRKLGFRERESRLAICRARTAVDEAHVTPEGLLRSALALLTPANG